MLVYGTRIKYKKLGYVADFCALCCEVRQFSIERVGAAGHLYYVSFGEGKLVEYRRVCLHCHTQYQADTHDYRTLAPAPGPVAALQQETFHNLEQARRHELELARQVRADPHALPFDVRMRMLAQPFLILSMRLEQRSSLSQGESSASYMRREIYPLLGSALARLKPRGHELEQTLERLRQMKDAVARKVKLPQLTAAIAAAEQPPARAPLSRRSGGGVPAGYMEAARLFRLMSLLALVGLLLMGLTMAGDLARDEPLDGALLLFAGAMAAVPALLHFVIVPGIVRHEERARMGGIAIATLVLLAIPIGTLVGGYLLWCLTSGWRDYHDADVLAA